MAGPYSSIPLTPHNFEVGIGFTDSIVRYYFHDGASFEEVRLDGDFVESRTFRQWERVSETKARISRIPEDYASLEWYELDLARDEFGCTNVVWTAVDSDTESGDGPTMWPGEVCVVVDEPIPAGDRETYHLEWCGEPPPGCAIDGCPCEN